MHPSIHRLAGLLLLTASIGAQAQVPASTLPRSAATPAPTQTSVSPASQSLLRTPVGAVSSTAVSAVAAQRLRAAGLDPSRPDFSDRLRARLVNSRATLQRVVLPASPRPYSPAAQNKALNKTPPAALAQRPQRAAAALGGHLQIGPDVVLNGRLVPLDQGVPIPSFIQVPFTVPHTPNTPTPGQLGDLVNGLEKALEEPPSAATLRLTVPACGLQMQWTTTVSGMNNYFPLSADDAKGIRTWGADFYPQVDATFDARWSTLPGLGATAHPGTIFIDLGDGRFGSRTGNFSGELADEAHDLFVTADPNLGSDDPDMQLPPNVVMLSSPGVQRLNLGITPLQGTDVIGVSLPLAPGYVASARIVATTSVADVDHLTPPDNSYRGAAVSIQPTAGRLQTSVQWHVGPGDSLSYRLEWQFRGPRGQRPLRTMRLRGPCDS